MGKPALLSFLSIALMAGTWTVSPKSYALEPAITVRSVIPTPVEHPWTQRHSPPARQLTDLAQLFFPPAGQRSVLRVVGKGEARQPADTAHIELDVSESSDVSGEFPEETPFQGGSNTPVSLTKKDLQPIVDALIQSGIPEAEIMVKITQPRSTGFPLPIPPIGSAGKATVDVKLEQPTRDRIEAIITTAREATEKEEKLLLDGVKVRFEVKDCPQLEAKAYAAAVQDARNRAEAIAKVLDAKLSAVPSVAEPFYGVFLPGCNAEQRLPFTPEDAGDELDSLEVEVKRDIFVTYTVK